MGVQRGLLAIETSTRDGSVALWAGGEVVFEASFYADRSHNSAVFEPLVELLRMAGETGIGHVVAGTGPGSYTGARVGIAAGQGVAMAMGVGFSGLASVCGADIGVDDYAVVGDARRGMFYWVEVRGRRVAGGVDLVRGREALDVKAGGSGLRTITFDESLGGIERARPTAGRLAQAAASLPPEEREAGTVEPLYLGAPFVTTPKPRGIG